MNLNLDQWQREILDTKGSIILCSGRQVGKSTIISIRDGERACKNENESILIISATERQAEEIFIKTLTYIQDNYPKMIKKGKDRPTKHRIKLTNGSIIRCLPTGMSGIGIRGFTITKLTADEAAFIPEEVWGAVTPMLLTTGGDMDLLSTPHGRAGYFYECYKNENKEFEVFHVNSEAVIKNRPISDTWTEKQRDAALRHLEREKARMSELEYAQEYLGEFIDEFRQFFPDELIKRRMTAKREDQVYSKYKYALGIDVARLGEDECCFEILKKVEKKVVHVENIIIKKSYLNEVYDKVLFLDKLYNFENIYIDDGGIGVGVFDYLLSNPQTKKKVVAINNRSRSIDKDDKHKKKLLKEDLYFHLLGLMERGEIDLLQDDEVYLSLKSIQFEIVKEKNAITKTKISGSYSHITEGLIRAAWCVKDQRLRLWVR